MLATDLAIRRAVAGSGDPAGAERRFWPDVISCWAEVSDRAPCGGGQETLPNTV